MSGIFLFLMIVGAALFFVAKGAKNAAVKNPEAAKEIGKYVVGRIGQALRK